MAFSLVAQLDRLIFHAAIGDMAHNVAFNAVTTCDDSGRIATAELFSGTLWNDHWITS